MKPNPIFKIKDIKVSASFKKGILTYLKDIPTTFGVRTGGGWIAICPQCSSVVHSLGYSVMGSTWQFKSRKEAKDKLYQHSLKCK